MNNEKNAVTQYELESALYGNTCGISLDNIGVIYEGKHICMLTDIFDFMGELSSKDYYNKATSFNGVELRGDVSYSISKKQIIIE